MTDKLVLNVGYADLRKGFDLFLQNARQLCAEDDNLHFVWAGALSVEMERWVKADLGTSEVDKRIHLIGFTERMSDYYSACDVLFLTSREDPYPTVVLEAMAVGAPVVIFKETTGFDSLMSEYGYSADRADPTSVRKALNLALYEDTDKQKSIRSAYIDKHCRFDDYVFDVLRLLLPDLEKVSVVVPNYNYEQYMPARLGSVFNQTYPIFETIVLDDASSDNSLKAIERVASDSSRSVNLVSSDKNSGNTFKQWKKGLELCRGDFVWIAEADDLSEASFIAESIHSFDADTVMSYTDSAQIQTNGELLAKSYDYYFNTVDKALFSTDSKIAGQEFVQRALSVKNVILNVSAVLWRRESLSGALDRIGQPLLDYKLVGDWRLYLEVLLQERASIAFIAESLNTHRRHQGSVTHQLDHQMHLDEIQSIHQFVLDNCPMTEDTEAAIAAYVRELEIQFGLVDVSAENSADDSQRRAA